MEQVQSCPRVGPSGSTPVQNLPGGSLTTAGLAKSLPSAGTQELVRSPGTAHREHPSSGQSSPGCSTHCCPGLPVPFFLEENYTLKKRLQQRGILLPQVLITDCLNLKLLLQHSSNTRLHKWYSSIFSRGRDCLGLPIRAWERAPTCPAISPHTLVRITAACEGLQ